MKNWTVKNKKLVREVVFKDFNEVLNIVNNIGAIAEKLDHHPDIKIYDYKKLCIEIYSHKKGRITDKDHLLAGEIENVLAK
jgi:4a-hydroxytetrahydrobiopterin dehydratase